MISFKATISKFGPMGEKTGWTYITIPAAQACKLHDTDRRSFRVKGKLDHLALAGAALIPMGEGDYILPLNAAMRKAIRKPLGASIQVQLTKDNAVTEINADLIACLDDEPAARAFFDSLAPSHQRYFSQWVQEAKTEGTRAKRLARVMEGLSRSMNFGEMMRYFKARREG